MRLCAVRLLSQYTFLPSFLITNRSIPSIVRAGAGLFGVNSVATRLAAATQTCSVQSLLVLYGLPRLLTGSIVAHELTHAWVGCRCCYKPCAVAWSQIYPPAALKPALHRTSPTLLVLTLALSYMRHTHFGMQNLAYVDN